MDQIEVSYQDEVGFLTAGTRDPHSEGNLPNQP